MSLLRPCVRLALDNAMLKRCQMPAIAVPSAMASAPASAPILFDRALLRARQARAAIAGAETFLRDRIGEEMAERLQGVLRRFDAAADIASPGGLGSVLAGRVGMLSRIEVPDD